MNILIFILSALVLLLLAGCYNLYRGKHRVCGTLKTLSDEKISLNEKLLETNCRVQAILERSEDLQQQWDLLQKENASLVKEKIEIGEQLVAANCQVETLREQNSRQQEEREKQQEKELELLRQEMRLLAEQLGNRQREQLQSANKEQLNMLLSPLEQNIRDFREKISSSDAAMREQVQQLLRQTQQIGNDANELSRALRSGSKTQGDWGEAVLHNLLEASGLSRGRDFDLQVSANDSEGNRFRPDVIVYLPDNKKLIIDAKVSLTAFVDYVNATDEKDRSFYLKKHIESIRSHIKELQDADYMHRVDNSIGYVLMFIPVEASYIAAVGADDHLITDAYKKQVIIVNPTNLLMALQLTYNLWQTERQRRNVQEIYRSAESVYKKFVGFAKNYEIVGQRITQLQKSYEDSRKQLTTGPANVVRQLEQWRKKGMDASASIPESLLLESDGGGVE